MKKILLALIFAFITLTAFGQTLNMSINGKVEHMPNDLDAKVYYPVKDWNDNLCALIKVRTTNELSSPLVLDVGGIGLKERREMENGEIWFYVPYQAKNLKFTCKGYTDVPPVSVQLQAGAVYIVNLITDAALQVVHNAVLSTNYMKLSVNEPNATLRLGKSKDYELIYTVLDGTFFSKLLNYGTYYYRIEHPLYEPAEGTITLGANTPTVNVNLRPTYGLLTISSTPSGAKVFIDNKEVGKTPCSLDTKFPKGDLKIMLQYADYYPLMETVNIHGNGERQTSHFSLVPQFGTVTCLTDDIEAEIWVDDEFKGKGSWTGQLSSISQHKLEAKRAGHQSQSIAFSVKDGETITMRISPPIPLYGTLNIESTPPEAAIRIDGKDAGTSPMMTQVISGSHTIELSKNGYQSVSFSVTVEHNKTTNVNRTLAQSADQNNYSNTTSTPIASTGEGASSDRALILFYQGKEAYYAEKYSEAFRYLSEAAEMGHPSAQYLLGQCYSYGYGVAKNDIKHREWHQKAADQGHSDAQFSIALAYRYGTSGYHQNREKAIEWYTKAAEGGHSYSIKSLIDYGATPAYYLVKYREGDDANNDSKAFKLFMESAKSGYVAALYEVGYCYYYGKGVKEDGDKATSWYLKAAEKGHCRSQHIIGTYYRNGWGGMPKDREKAIYWHRLATMGDDVTYAALSVKALIEMGVLSSSGTAKASSASSSSRTETSDNPKTLYSQGLSYKSQNKDTQAFECFKKAAEMGHTRAQYELALCYKDGKGVSKNETETGKWLQKAADGGDYDAMDYLAIGYIILAFVILENWCCIK